MDLSGVEFAHHVRLEHVRSNMDKALLFFKDISGAVAILHTKGKKGEHPHVHIWYPTGKHILTTAVLNRFKKTPYFMNFKGQTQWSTRPHDSFSNWLHYVTKGCKGQQVLLNNRDIEISDHKKCEVCDSSNLGTISLIPVTIPEISKKVPMRQRFLLHCEKVLGWKKNEHFASGSFQHNRELVHAVSNTLTDFYENAFTFPEGIRMCRNAIYVFGDEDIKKYVKSNNAYNFAKAVFEHQ